MLYYKQACKKDVWGVLSFTFMRSCQKVAQESAWSLFVLATLVAYFEIFSSYCFHSK